MSAATDDALLASRARALATPRHALDASAVDDLLDVLVFVIGDERLAMPLSSTIARRAALSLMRYSSASGPNSIDSGIATAPSR